MAVSVIASSGGDYTSLSAWEAAVQGTLAEIETAECEAFEDTTGVTVDGSTTTSSFYHRIIPAAGAEAQMPWSTSAFRIVTNNGNAITAADPFVRIEDIQMQVSETAGFTGNSYCVRLPGIDSGIRVTGCHMRMGTSTGQFTLHGILMTGGAGAIVANNYFVGFASPTGTSRGLSSSDFVTPWYFYNNIIVNCTVGVHGGTDADCRAKNNLTYGNGTDWTGSFHADSTNNASEDGTAPNTNEVTITADPFVDYAGGDFHIESGSEVHDAGADLSADADFPFSTDFDGDTRSGTWDIGADEITSSDILLVVADALIGLAAESPALTQANTLAVADALIALAVDSPALTQANVLAVADALVALAADSPGLTQANVLAIADALVALSAESPALTQANVLAVADALVVLALESPTLELAGVLAVADALISLVSESPSLTQQNVLAVVDALIALASESPALVQANTLAVADALIALGIESPAAAEDVVAAAVASGKYRPEHAAALADIGAATGFSAEHASALRDLRKAGV